MTSVEDEELFDLELRLLLEAVYARYHHDFRHYARASLKRRVRQALARLECRTLSALQERILRDPEAFAVLFSFMTIGVTEMFRDPPFFRALRERVVPLLATYPSLKVWVAGCSTGEEVYSLRILLREEGLDDRALMYATDIDPAALARAQEGIYALDRVAGFSSAYLAAGGKASLSDYYTAGASSVVFDRTLRENVVFSDHSLATDHVFASVELVTCRNVLIYFDRDLQDRALGLFRDSLEPGGFLGLGSRESVQFSRHAAELVPFCADERIYRKQTRVTPIPTPPNPAPARSAP
jgi:chemotaxis protein methyltransferase CheR